MYAQLLKLAPECCGLSLTARCRQTLLGKVAQSSGQGGSGTALRPAAAGFCATPHALRALHRPGHTEHPCLDALLGVLWAAPLAEEELVGAEADAAPLQLGAAAVTMAAMVYRDPAAGAGVSAAAALGRANAARHALTNAGGS